MSDHKTEIQLTPAVRYAAVFLMMFALLNVARESTYLIGSIQVYGMPQMRDYEGVVHSLLSLLLGGMAAGLRRASRKAWFTAVFGGGTFAINLWGEILYLWRFHMMGNDKGDVQILLLGFAIAMLVLSVILLITPQARIIFWPPIDLRENGKILDAPAPQMVDLQ